VTLDDGTNVGRELQPSGAFGVSPDYFATLGIAVTAGRPFTLIEDEKAAPVAIINEWAAKRWWPKGSAVGRTFTIDTAAGKRATLTVVGVVKDNLAAGGNLLLAKPGPEVFRPYKQSFFWVSTYYTRSGAPTARLIDEMSNATMRVIPPNGRPGSGRLSAQVDAQVARVRGNVYQLAGFAVIGLLLSVTGLYGVLSYLVQQRTQEIGIRGVLGAQQSQIVAMVLRSALKLAAIGIVLGLVTAALTVRFIQSLLFGTPSADPVVYASVAAVFALVALAAGYLPARRAAQVDPAIALRAG
jgi:putative ABC transport system permease protein